MISSTRPTLLFMAISSMGLFLVMSQQATMAEPLSIPWECSSYRGETQARCITILNELQHNTLAQLQSQLRAQQTTVNQLNTQIAQQAIRREPFHQETNRFTIHLTPLLSPLFLYPSFPVVTLHSRPGLWFSFGHIWTIGPSYPYASLWWNPRPYRFWYWLY